MDQKGKKMDAEDTYDGSRNHRPCMDSFGVDKFQSVVEKYLIIRMCLAPTYASEKILQNSFRPKISSNITAIFFNWDYG